MFDEKQQPTPPTSSPMDIPGCRDPPLIDLFQPCSPSCPRHDSDTRRRSWLSDSAVPTCMSCHRRFAFLLRRHHCRRCGMIFCADCSNNRITRLQGPNDTNYYRICNGCMDELLEGEQALLIHNDRCALSFAMPFRKTAAINPATALMSCSNAAVAGSGTHVDENLQVNLLRFDEDVAVAEPSSSSAALRGGLGPSSFAPSLSRDSITPTRETVLSRLTSAALSLPARLRSSSRLPTDTTLDTCPVCSLSLRKWDNTRRQLHVEECLYKTETSGGVLGDRFTTHRWSAVSGSKGKECSICYEEFVGGQRIAVLNCLCQFHEKCINAWFDRGKHCPFHGG